MKDFLFNEFNTLTPAAWKQKIQVDLKGDDYNESLIWKSNEDVHVKPFYTKEDRHFNTIPLAKNGYKICQSIFVDDVIIANKLAKDSIDRGASAIQFIAKTSFDYKNLFDNINTKEIFIYLNFEFLNAAFVSEIDNYCKSNCLYFQIDIIGNLAKTGNWFSNLNSDLKEKNKYIQSVNNSICVDASIYQNAGASIIQELTYALAHTNEYIELFGKSIAPKLHYIFSVGSNYFFEIAKLRAFRILVDALLNEHGVKNTPIHIFTKPSLRNKTIYDYNVNMLRTTTECMSAILGGSDTISNISYDSIYHKSNEFGERISRNQLLILKEEAYLSEAHKFANGAYYIESIEKQFAEKSLQLFKQIEKSGGFLKQLKKGTIQNKINENAKKQQTQFDQNEIILLGTNKLTSENDFMKNELQIYPFLKKKNTKTLIVPILQKRLADQLEQNRLKME
ncbi:methylmalonyl-CoA mutase subunit beta [Flavobacteriaceae bacterium]|nr:methylmalonyl-CoA mutase subunit beta [Flavobacteriaceae bacterium]